MAIVLGSEELSRTARPHAWAESQTAMRDAPVSRALRDLRSRHADDAGTCQQIGHAPVCTRSGDVSSQDLWPTHLARTKALDVAVPTERRAAGMSDYDLSTMFPVASLVALDSDVSMRAVREGQS